ncbi:hypothetical protein IAG44_15000 [Streptomyces roseirectus]|uniref:Uncharacterized protein n=1 Tax=Streptomyces roseirectus TaxID=2768066 RepID=A0A7H0ICV0_9ACTN|nr:hypothetical protein [Streptomyces roseirectus]QNP70616.1 hypothetical protein IAG44_15000 [Streptomyces roseirectus]
MTDLPRLLAAALTPPGPDAAAEAEALAAFRDARDSGALTAPTRRCDDWRREDEAPCDGTP